MATPRDVLEKLPLADLKVLAEGIAIANRRKASSVIDALGALGPAHLRVPLMDLPRDVPKGKRPGAAPRRQLTG